MLQQTRVAVVRDRYADFLRRFPSVERLAAAKLPEVLAAWSGLGYYRRARALHAAAQRLVEDGLRFPRTAEELASLPGIGRYTAAAIASIAFDQPCAVVDGNVERVLSRLFRIRECEAWRAAGELLSPGRPGDFNQAMMELGATVCLPKAPLCAQCPVFAWCRTRGAGASRGSSLRRKKSIAYRLAIRGRTHLPGPEGRSQVPDAGDVGAAANAAWGGNSGPAVKARHHQHRLSGERLSGEDC